MLKFFSDFFADLLGSRNKRVLKGYGKFVAAINALEPGLKELSDEELGARTPALRERIADGASLDDVLPEAFALVREASCRTLGLRHFDVQLIGGITLHQGKIAEMRTGEGKTLVATLPAYLNSLGGDGVHIITVNDYLAERDANWMGPVYRFLGLTVGVVKAGQDPVEKRESYKADITYGTNNEFGFDYLRDNLAFRLEDRAQRKLSFAIVDEVDSILIDEARTPLIISGRSEESTDLYLKINKLVPSLKPHNPPEGAANDEIEAAEVNLTGKSGEDLGTMSIDEARSIAAENECHLIETDATAKPSACLLFIPGDYTIDEKAKQAHLTEEGHDRVERLLEKAGILAPGESLYDAGNIKLMHHLNAALRATGIFKREVDYIVKDGEVVIVDEFTGRTMAGRRWSDGLHQAIEAKEGVRVKEENQTIASITFQNYFRLYSTLSGMTGTADTEAYEFQQIYGLEVVVIPTHLEMIRDDAPDLVYLTQKDKFDAIIEDIQDCQERGQPALVGTTSIETSEFVSGLLKQKSIQHQVLNAKYHAQEAQIIVEAGRPGTVTIATNMAGRGTDIVLGGNLEAELAALDADEGPEADALREDWKSRHAQVIEAGGLHIICTERHESRRIDNQLRGRSGRQGDIGSSRFYLSMEDNLMRIFGDPERTKRLLSRAGMQEGEAIESRMLSKQIERAQRKVEAHNFDIRKQLLEYDDVANDQRKVVYQQRSELMEADDIADAIVAIREEAVNLVIDDYIPPESVEELWDVAGLAQAVEREFGSEIDVGSLLEGDHSIDETGMRDAIVAQIKSGYDAKVESVGPQVVRELEKGVMLRQLDMHWKEHIGALDHLRQGIHLRGYAQKNPKQEYKRESFDMFGDMLDRVKHDTIAILSKIQIRRPEDVAAVEPKRSDTSAMSFQHAEAPSLAAAPRPQPQPGQAQPGQPPRRLGVGGQKPAQPEPAEPYVREQPKVGRNQPCPCGSGKKYKHCHGRLS
ncbi:MAG: preprotein translocase subunit SecA [Gammaproteobacteria bacterium]